MDARFKVVASLPGTFASSGEDLADALERLGFSIGIIGEVLDWLESVSSELAESLRFATDGGEASLAALRRSEDVGGGFLLRIAFAGQVANVGELEPAQMWLGLEALKIAGSGRCPGDFSQPTALVVDDTAVSLALTSRLLEKAGFRVLAATSGKSATEHWERADLALVVLDFFMPDENGDEVAIRMMEFLKRAGRPTPTVVGVTASVTDELRARAISAGMTSLEPKPIHFDRLVELRADLASSSVNSSAVATSAVPTPRVAPASVAPLGNEGWEGEERLRRRLVNAFFADTSAAVNGFAKCLSRGDLGELESRVHAFKGGADVVQAYEVSAACKALLDRLRSADTRPIGPFLAQISQSCKRALAEAERLGLIDK